MNEQDFLKDAIAAMRDADAAFARAENSEHLYFREANLRTSDMYARDASLLATMAIAQDLRRIADRLDGFSDNLANEDVGRVGDAFRVNVLR